MDFSQYQMINRYERIRALPEKELDRRWGVIRQIMKEHGLNVILISDPGRNGTASWLLGTGNKVPQLIVFPLDDAPTAVYGGKSLSGGGFNPYVLPARTPVDPGIYGRVVNANEFSAEMVSKYAGKAHARIGVFAPETFGVKCVRDLNSAMPGLEMVDLSHEIALARSIKSEYDIELCRASAQMHTIFCESVPSVLRLGRTMREVLMDLRRLLKEFGSAGEDLGPMMKVVDKYHNHRTGLPWGPMDDRRFQSDDMVWFLLEIAGPGGQFSANARYWSFTDPSEEFMERYRLAVRAQDIVQDLLKPGNTIRKVADTANAFIRGAGQYTDDCCFLHSLGYEMGEYPMLSDHSVPTEPKSIDEDEPLRPGTIMIAHPQIGRKEKNERHEMVLLVETYMIGEEGAERLTTYPRDQIYRLH